MKFTLEDFRNGKVAIQGDGTQKMQHFLKANMEKNTWEPSAGRGYYYTMKEGYVLGNCGSGSLPVVQFSDLVQPTDLPKAYKGKIADFPQEVVEMMLLRQVEQGNKKDVSVFEVKATSSKYDGGFIWDQSPEGLDFWDDVIRLKDFNVFFDRYPKQQQVIYTKEYIRDNKIAVYCRTEQEYEAVAQYLHWSPTAIMRDTCISFYMDSWGQCNKSWHSDNDYTIISASEVLNQQQTNMNKNIIGYKLKKDAEQFRKAALIMINRSAFIDNEYGGKVDVKTSSNISIYKNAGVLDLWFEPVYSEEEQYKVGDWVLTSGSANGWGTGLEINNAVVQYVGDRPYTNEVIVMLNGKECYTGKSQIVRKATAAEIEAANTTVVSVGGQFNVTVKNKKVYHGSNSEDITAYVKGIVEEMGRTRSFAGYSAVVEDVIFSKCGCENKRVKLSDWKHIYDMIK